MIGTDRYFRQDLSNTGYLRCFSRVNWWVSGSGQVILGQAVCIPNTGGRFLFTVKDSEYHFGHNYYSLRGGANLGPIFIVVDREGGSFM